VPQGGESLASVGSRVREACDELWAEAAEHDVVVVTHVSPLKAAVAWALEAPDQTSWRMFVDVASLTRIGSSGGAGKGSVPPPPSLRTFNETEHRPSR
jgi:broad specificity phosphatase PhoE